jgi:hypothetical protein
LGADALRKVALIVGGVAAAVLGCAAWLLFASLRFYFSEEYAPNSAAMPSHTAGGLEADGSGILLPALLLAAAGAFLMKFAINLWRKP